MLVFVGGVGTAPRTHGKSGRDWADTGEQERVGEGEWRTREAVRCGVDFPRSALSLKYETPQGQGTER